MTSLLNILTYLFDPYPVGQFKMIWLFVGLAVVGIAGSIAIKMYLKMNKEDKILKKLFRDLPGKLASVAIAEVLYVIFRYEQMPYLSIRFLHYAILGTGLYLLVTSVQKYVQVYPAEKKHHNLQMHANKYLPRKGGKKH